jgi:serine/threonine protein kinase/tetratricopeptide (TPR) repeat protein
MLSTDSTTWLNHQYQLGEQLGAGGMGTVYQASDRLSGASVALKRVLLRDQKSSDSDRERLRISLSREFRTLASLRHPNIISVLDYGFDAEHQPFYTMQLLDKAQTLNQAAVDDSPLDKIGLILQVLQALMYLHRRNVLHRDLKPSNVMVVNRQVKVLDFGLAVFADQAVEDDAAGSLAYMAPEVLQGAAASPSADLYAVGVMLYELLAGQHPFRTQDTGKLIMQIMNEDPDLTPIEDISTTLSNRRTSAVETKSSTTSSDPFDTSQTALIQTTLDGSTVQSTSVVPDSANALVSLLQRLLTKNPAHRYQDAGEVIAALSYAANLPMPPETLELRESYLQAARFVGRDRELDQLAAASRDLVRNRQGAAFLIGGESGIGKTRLLDEWRSLALVEGARVLRTEALGEGTSPYSIWLNLFVALSSVVELTDEEASVLKPYVPILEALLNRQIADAPPLEPQQAQLRLCRSVSAAFSRILQPTIIILENLHWISSENLELLKSLQSLISSAPLLFVGSYRSDERPDLPNVLPGFTSIALERLNERSLSELSESILGEVGRQQAVLDLLKRETEGNAFFLVEIVRTLAEERGRLDAIGQGALPAQVFPGGVRALIQRRIEHISADWQPPLRLVAVMGRQLDLLVLRNVLGEQLDSWLVRCSDAALLNSPDGKWQFAHDKIRTYVLDLLSPDERTALHHQAAVSLENAYPQSLPLAALAYHWGQANYAEKELFYAEAAGFESIQNSANVEARRYFERALELVHTQDSTPEHEIRLRFGLSTALVASVGFGVPEVAENMKEAQRLSKILQKPETSFPILRMFYMHYLFLGDMKTLHDLSDKLFELAELSNNQEFLMEAHHVVGISTFHSARFDQARDHLLKAWGMYDFSKYAERISNYGMESSAFIGGYLSLAYAHLGEKELALKIAEETLEIAQRTGHPFSIDSAIGSMVSVYLVNGNLDAAAPFAQEMLTDAMNHNFPHWTAWGLVMVGHLQGNAEGVQLIKQGIALHRMIGSRVSYPTEQGLLAATLLQIGRVEEAGQAVELGLADVAERGEGWWQTELYRLRGKVLEANGDCDGAATAYRLSIATAQIQKAYSFGVQAEADLKALLKSESHTSV